MPYYEGTARVDENIKFYANYTNRTSGAAINTATCNITFSDLSALMSFNSTKQLFEYNRTFSSVEYNKQYNISCSDNNFETLSASDSIDISANCSGYVDPGKDWIINGSNVVLCKGENLLLNNTNLLITDNATLILEDSNLTLIVGTNNITVLKVMLQDRLLIYIFMAMEH